MCIHLSRTQFLAARAFLGALQQRNHLNVLELRRERERPVVAFFGMFSGPLAAALRLIISRLPWRCHVNSDI
jgi:hypothetical protein